MKYKRVIYIYFSLLFYSNIQKLAHNSVPSIHTILCLFGTKVYSEINLH